MKNKVITCPFCDDGGMMINGSCEYPNGHAEYFVQCIHCWFHGPIGKDKNDAREKFSKMTNFHHINEESLYKKYKYEDIGGAMHKTPRGAYVSSVATMLCFIFGDKCLYVDEILIRGMIKHNLIDVDKIFSMYDELKSVSKS